MTKREFTERFFKKAELKQKAQAGKIVNAFLETIEECVADGEKIEFKGFGSFVIKEIPARKGINFSTGDEIVISARKAVKFKVGKEFKEAVNKKR